MIIYYKTHYCYKIFQFPLVTLPIKAHTNAHSDLIPHTIAGYNYPLAKINMTIE